MGCAKDKGGRPLRQAWAWRGPSSPVAVHTTGRRRGCDGLGCVRRGSTIDQAPWTWSEHPNDRIGSIGSERFSGSVGSDWVRIPGERPALNRHPRESRRLPAHRPAAVFPVSLVFWSGFESALLAVFVHDPGLGPFFLSFSFSSSTRHQDSDQHWDHKAELSVTPDGPELGFPYFHSNLDCTFLRASPHTSHSRLFLHSSHHPTTMLSLLLLPLLPLVSAKLLASISATSPGASIRQIGSYNPNACPVQYPNCAGAANPNVNQIYSVQNGRFRFWKPANYDRAEVRFRSNPRRSRQKTLRCADSRVTQVHGLAGHKFAEGKTYYLGWDFAVSAFPPAINCPDPQTPCMIQSNRMCVPFPVCHLPLHVLTWNHFSRFQ